VVTWFPNRRRQKHKFLGGVLIRALDRAQKKEAPKPLALACGAEGSQRVEHANRSQLEYARLANRGSAWRNKHPRRFNAVLTRQSERGALETIKRLKLKWTDE
jgi:hypothetical protein